MSHGGGIMHSYGRNPDFQETIAHWSQVSLLSPTTQVTSA